MVTRTYLTGKFVAHWDLSNYDTFDMKALGEDSYRDLSGIGIPVAKKCKALARDSLSLLAYVK